MKEIKDLTVLGFIVLKTIPFLFSHHYKKIWHDRVMDNKPSLKYSATVIFVHYIATNIVCHKISF